MAEDSLPGTGMNPELVANSILVRAFRDNIPVSPMKLQKLLFFVTCLYQRNTSVRLLTESFQPWKYGPVVAVCTTSSRDSAAVPSPVMRATPEATHTRRTRIPTLR